MTEVKVTCLCNQLHLADLNMTLTKGSVVFLSVEDAAKSKDLTIAERARGVKREFVRRYISHTEKSGISVARKTATPVQTVPSQTNPLAEVKGMLESFRMQVLEEIKQVLGKPKKKSKG